MAGKAGIVGYALNVESVLSFCRLGVHGHGWRLTWL